MAKRLEDAGNPWQVDPIGLRRHRVGLLDAAVVCRRCRQDCRHCEREPGDRPLLWHTSGTRGQTCSGGVRSLCALVATLCDSPWRSTV